jgi:GT2 family glycosyltransferase
MLSIIICSINDARFAAVRNMYSRVLQSESFEIIRIPDARSLCEGYTRGIAGSSGDHFIFSHDDIEILSLDFAQRLSEHLARFDLIGIAGTSRLIAGEWPAAGPPYIFGQVAQPYHNGEFIVPIFGVPGRIVSGIQALDGVFLATHRRVVEKIPFDAETFDGFDHYDLDFTFAAHLAGFKLAVANDIHLLHLSWGKHDEKWPDYNARFNRKYAGRLSVLPPRRSANAWVGVRTKEEVMQIMADAVRNSEPAEK